MCLKQDVSLPLPISSETRSAQCLATVVRNKKTHTHNAAATGTITGSLSVSPTRYFIIVENYVLMPYDGQQAR